MSIVLVANIAVMLIAFLAMREFLDEVLGWGGRMVDIEISFEVGRHIWINSFDQKVCLVPLMLSRALWPNRKNFPIPSIDDFLLNWLGR